MKVIIKNQFGRFLFDDLYRTWKFGNKNESYHKVWGSERQEVKSVAFFGNGKSKIEKREPQIRINNEHKLEKSGLCWTIKKADKKTIKEITEIDRQIKELQEKKQELLKEKFLEVEPVTFEELLTLAKSDKMEEHLKKVFNQMKGLDKDIRKWRN